MSYTVQQLANLAGVTVRTLHHYDEIGLLKPARVKSNGYRQYEEPELLKLQQIMFFRELEFPLPEIKKILDNPRFDLAQALADHRELIELKRRRMADLLKTIDKTLKKISQQKNMTDKELYDGFDNEAYAEEARERWGNTEAYRQSLERVKKMSKAELAQIQKEGEELLREIAAKMDEGAASPKVQALIAKHYNNLRHFYEPSLEMYRGLGQMYVDDARFTAYFEKFRPGLAAFMRDAILVFCAREK